MCINQATETNISNFGTSQIVLRVIYILSGFVLLPGKQNCIRNIYFSKQFHPELLFQNKKEIKQSVNPLQNFSKSEINHLKNTPDRTTKTRNPEPVGTKWKSRSGGATCNTFVSSNEHKLIHTFIHSQ